MSPTGKQTHMEQLSSLSRRRCSARFFTDAKTGMTGSALCSGIGQVARDYMHALLTACLLRRELEVLVHWFRQSEPAWWQSAPVIRSLGSVAMRCGGGRGCGFDNACPVLVGEPCKSNLQGLELSTHVTAKGA